MLTCLSVSQFEVGAASLPDPGPRPAESTLGKVRENGLTFMDTQATYRSLSEVQLPIPPEISDSPTMKRTLHCLKPSVKCRS